MSIYSLIDWVSYEVPVYPLLLVIFLPFMEVFSFDVETTDINTHLIHEKSQSLERGQENSPILYNQPDEETERTLCLAFSQSSRNACHCHY